MSNAEVASSPSMSALNLVDEMDAAMARLTDYLSAESLVEMKMRADKMVTKSDSLLEVSGIPK